MTRSPWVCFKTGLQKEAETAIGKALAHGTAEAPVLYHAAMIARAGGDPVLAESISPAFDLSIQLS